MVDEMDFILIIFGFLLGFIGNVVLLHYKSSISKKKDEELTNKLLKIELNQTVKFLENIENRLTKSFEKQTFDEVIEYLKSDQAKSKGSGITLITEKISTKVYDDRYSKILNYSHYFSEEVLDILTNFYNNKIFYLNNLRDAIEKIGWDSGDTSIAVYTSSYCIYLKQAIEEAKELAELLPN